MGFQQFLRLAFPEQLFPTAGTNPNVNPGWKTHSASLSHHRLHPAEQFEQKAQSTLRVFTYYLVTIAASFKGERLVTSSPLRQRYLRVLSSPGHMCAFSHSSMHIRHSRWYLRLCLCFTLVRKVEIKLDKNLAGDKLKMRPKSKPGQGVFVFDSSKAKRYRFQGPGSQNQHERADSNRRTTATLPQAACCCCTPH